MSVPPKPVAPAPDVSSSSGGNADAGGRPRRMPDVSLLPPGDNVAVARALVFAMGEEWQRADILDRLEIAYGWLAKGGQAVHVATELRRIADVLDADPAAYFQAALKRLIADLCPGCDQAAA